MFFYGDEEFNISNEIKKLKSKLDKNFIEMAYKEFDNLKFSDLIACISVQPMMFGKMLIVIDCIKYFKTGFEDKELKQFEQVLENVSKDLDIVFRAWVNPESKSKIGIDKRKKFFKILSKYNSKEFARIPSYKTAELEEWIKNQSKKHDLKIQPEAVSLLLMQVGGNLRMLDSELGKLKVFAGDNSVTKETVKEICVNNEDLFLFIDYLATDNKQKAVEEYQKLLTSTHPLAILSVLHNILHSKIQIKANLKPHSADDIAKMINIHPYRVKLEIQKLKNISLKKLIKLKENLTEAEYKIKSGQSNLTPEREVEYAILR
ncbi:DNA polymerase III subunit delta [bacterium]|nr:DNA polymerase III subunit delta [bacterium]